MTRSLLFALALAATLAASLYVRRGSSAPADTTADKAAIDKVRADFAAAYSAGDLEKLGAMYTSDIMLMETGQRAAVGKEAVLARIKENSSQATLTLQLVGEETTINGNLAYDRGAYMITIAPKAAGAPEMMEHGKYIVILNKQADGWKISREIGNSNDPPPAPPQPAAPAKTK